VASEVGGQIKALTDVVATLKGLISAATSAAKEATQAVKEANTWATTANMNADAAKNAVKDIYSKISTIKHWILPPAPTLKTVIHGGGLGPEPPLSLRCDSGGLAQ
jgi:hypothetical protein